MLTLSLETEKHVPVIHHLKSERSAWPAQLYASSLLICAKLEQCWGSLHIKDYGQASAVRVKVQQL